MEVDDGKEGGEVCMCVYVKCESPYMFVIERESILGARTDSRISHMPVWLPLVVMQGGTPPKTASKLGGAEAKKGGVEKTGGQVRIVCVCMFL